MKLVSLVKIMKLQKLNDITPNSLVDKELLFFTHMRLLSPAILCWMGGETMVLSLKDSCQSYLHPLPRYLLDPDESDM